MMLLSYDTRLSINAYLYNLIFDKSIQHNMYKKQYKNVAHLSVHIFSRSLKNASKD